MQKYRVTHIEWDCKDDVKLLKYDESTIKLSLDGLGNHKSKDSETV